MISFICMLFVMFVQLIAFVGYLFFYCLVGVFTFIAGIAKSDNSEEKMSNTRYRILEKRPGETFTEIFSCEDREDCKKKLAELRRENGLNVYIVKKPD